jgi:hypothetical protein
MAERKLSMALEEAQDDLPMTVRREKAAREAREREARQRESEEQAGDPMSAMVEPMFPHTDLPGAAGGLDSPQPAIVTALRIPFLHLMAFFMKAVLAAIPALLFLMVLLWLTGQALKSYLPWLRQMQIVITFPN